MGCQDTLLTSFVWSRTATDEDFDDTAVYEHADIQFRTRCLSRCDIISQFRVEQDAHTYADTDTDADADADTDADTDADADADAGALAHLTCVAHFR